MQITKLDLLYSLAQHGVPKEAGLEIINGIFMKEPARSIQREAEPPTEEVSKPEYPRLEAFSDWVAGMTPGREFTIDTVVHVFNLAPVDTRGNATILGNMIARHPLCERVLLPSGYPKVRAGRAVFVKLAKPRENIMNDSQVQATFR